MRPVGEVERWSKEHVRNAKERIWRYFEAVAFKALTFELIYGGRIPRLSGPTVHESMDWENRFEDAAIRPHSPGTAGNASVK